MIRRILASLSLVAVLACPAGAQERVTIGTTRAIANSVLFLAEIQGHFKAEGLDVEMTAYTSDEDVVTALAGGATDLGLAGFTATAFNLGGARKIAAIAAQVREKVDYEGNSIVVSNVAYDRGIRKMENLANMSVATLGLGTTLHYQLGQIARVKKFSFASLTLKPQGSVAAIARTIENGMADAAILPGTEARDLLTSNYAKLVGWYSEIDEAQLGALFASAKAIESKRTTLEKFVRAYRRAAGEYYTLFMRHDRYGKRISNAKSQELAGKIARYVFPGRSKMGAVIVEDGLYYMERDARLDGAEIARQVAWYQSQGLVDKSVDTRAFVDSSFK
jgi:NitT/TauT family transport system substrate-binding protein